MSWVTHSGWTLSRVGDSALVVAFEDRIDPVINEWAGRVAAAVRRSDHLGVRDVVESFTTVTVHFDLLRTDVESLRREVERLVDVASAAAEAPEAARFHVRVPVCYGGKHGPDLSEVARFAGCSAAAVVERHAAATYRVYMLGFQPGFAYLGSVDPTIAAPRRDTPRVRVPAGSVGIAGPQTGVYPLDAPGGWQIIGRSPIRVFDPKRAEPFLLHGGDVVRFEPIDESAYDRFQVETAEQ